MSNFRVHSMLLMAQGSDCKTVNVLMPANHHCYHISHLAIASTDVPFCKKPVIKQELFRQRWLSVIMWQFYFQSNLNLFSVGSPVQTLIQGIIFCIGCPTKNISDITNTVPQQSNCVV